MQLFPRCILQGAIDFAELPILARQGVAGFAHKPNFRISHRNPPCKFLSSFFYKCILQGAIDFAVLRWRCCGAGGGWWSGMECRIAHRSPPCKFLGRCILQAAIDFAVLRMRSWSSRSNLRSGTMAGLKRDAARSSAWQALHLTLTNCGTASIYT
ncbi:MAG: hypothetical protein WA977_13555 [Halobacteriota archaeon]